MRSKLEHGNKRVGRYAKSVLWFVLVAVSVAGTALAARCRHTSSGAGEFSGERAYRDVVAQLALGPRVAGTPQGWAGGDFILQQLDQAGWHGQAQVFDYRGVHGRNVYAEKGAGGLIVLGAHYDSRPLADRDPMHPEQAVPGANDGASGVAVLLELARVLHVPRTGHRIRLAFFDAEDRGGIDGWPFSVGAEQMAALEEKVETLILLDMVGDREQQFYWERTSDAGLLREIWAVAARVGYGQWFVPEYKYAIVDDHTPFLNRGVRAVDIIDFDYPAWHTVQDTADKVAAESLLRAGRVVEEYLYTLGDAAAR